MMSSRPKLKIIPSPTDMVVEAVAFLGFALLLVAVVYYPQLPERIPMHFNFAGKVDAWGAKSGLLPLIWIGIGSYLLLTIISRFPHIFNYPVAITPENAERQYRNAVSLMRWLKMETMWLMVYITWVIFQVAQGKASSMSSALTPIVLVVIIGTCIIFLVRAYREH